MLRPLDFIVSKYQNINREEVPWYDSVRKHYIDACEGTYSAEITNIKNSEEEEEGPLPSKPRVTRHNSHLKVISNITPRDDDEYFSET